MVPERFLNFSQVSEVSQNANTARPIRSATLPVAAPSCFLSILVVGMEIWRCTCLQTLFLYLLPPVGWALKYTSG